MRICFAFENKRIGFKKIYFLWNMPLVAQKKDPKFNLSGIETPKPSRGYSDLFGTFANFISAGKATGNFLINI